MFKDALQLGRAITMDEPVKAHLADACCAIQCECDWHSVGSGIEHTDALLLGDSLYGDTGIAPNDTSHVADDMGPCP